MPLNRANTRTFHRTLYAGELQTITLLKRNDDQQQGTVVAYTLFECRRGQITRRGETILHDIASDHHATWHIPRSELDRVGVQWINNLDRIVENYELAYQNLARYWQPESDCTILHKLFENHLNVDCVRIDPNT